jgi:hypothetical protein
MKPDLTAPGMGVVSALADEVKSDLISYGLGSIIVNDHYMMIEGTSMAAPHVAGAVALLLQKNPAATNATLRSLLFSSARDDAFTRQHDGFFVNYVFGAGKLDLGRTAWVDPHETNDLASQAFAVVSGQSRAGYVERAADIDYFLLQGMQGGDTVKVDLTSLPQDYALVLQSRMAPLDNCYPGGMSTKATSNNAGTANESILYTAPTGVQVTQSVANYIRVSSPAGAVSGADSYLMKAILTRPETTSTHNSTATAQKLPQFVEMNVAGAIAAGEADFYSFGILPGKTMVLSAPGKLITIRDAAGNFVKSDVGTVTHTVPSGGLLLFEATYHAVVAGSNGTYMLNLKIQ